MKIKELFVDALPIIEKFSPTIGAAIGGPVGAATGYIIPLLASAFSVHPSDIPGLVAKIVADPDAQKKLSEIEDEHGDWIDTLQDSVSNLISAEINVKLGWAGPK
jgi:hypothetical protein